MNNKRIERLKSNRYQEWRLGEIDTTEYLDILWGLKAVGIGRNSRILELGAGRGLLIRFLREKGFRNTFGFDLNRVNGLVYELDLENNDPPEADCYIFQHFIEHIDQSRILQLLKYCYEKGRAVIGIAPGYYSPDPTHVVSHYEYEDLLWIIREVKPQYYLIRPDIMSYINPRVKDWLIIMSKTPIRGDALPIIIKLILLALKLLLGASKTPKKHF